MRILNLTQFNKTPEQHEVIEPSAEDKALIKSLLLFDNIPEHKELLDRAEQIALIATHYNPDHAMIGGAPYFLGYLEDELLGKEITPVYSFTKRVSEEHYNPETGENEKRFVFKHEGFVEVSHHGSLQSASPVNAINRGLLNITNHVATPDQIVDGVREPSNKEEIQRLITFNDIPSVDELKDVASKVADIVQKEGYQQVMTGGAPYLDRFLREELDRRGIDSYYAYSKQEIIKNDDGSSTKIFKHQGFVPSKNTAEFYKDKEEIR